MGHQEDRAPRRINAVKAHDDGAITISGDVAHFGVAGSDPTPNDGRPTET
jgi:hypothetical protein